MEIIILILCLIRTTVYGCSNYNFWFLGYNTLKDRTNCSCELNFINISEQLPVDLNMINVRAEGNGNREHIKQSDERNIRSVWDIGNGDRVLHQLSHGKLQDGPSHTKQIWLEWGPSFWGISTGTETFRQCDVHNCNVLSRNHHSVVNARLFSDGVSFLDLQVLRAINRTSSEIWIIHTLESPMAANNFKNLDNMFNWTATYRTDSTIVTPYAKWISFKDHISSDLSKINYAEHKTKKVAMFVSNCHTSNDRLVYAEELSKHIQVDIYGDCGNLSCSKNDNKHCMQILRKDYKFYLAFENSNCRDYITEKFYMNALGNNVLPVVMGAHPDDYKRSAPHHSYIHVEDFQSPKHLAEYLHTLDKNDQLYNQYFKWKGTGTFIDTKFWCRLCAMLNDPYKPNLIVSELDRWWRSERTCIRADQKWIT
ncbi:glycoprotein 3-alpha-L-fucosyltransferase A-like isoform X1 [Mytilus californianus]|uniref:glycoprotein 3-alpha-L-fucosyltransferase A-like isoform X1 n=1 Tax=Mytilus californianus TaxID=6549 RepID=UPI002247CAA2|nr:glycoprotein 3-alpha-L-fucosyltransferase A-like isoform X1 [Mytilus californianus]